MMLAAAVLLSICGPVPGTPNSGITRTAEITALAASSTDIDNPMLSDFGKYIRNPVVGFGVHGMNTATVGSSPLSSLALISLSFSLAMKTIDQTPLRGYSTMP